MRFVLDAGVPLALFMPDEDPDVVRYAQAVLDAIERGVDRAVVPALWHYEVAAVLLRAHRARKLSAEGFERALRFFGTIPIESHHETYTVGAIIERAQRYGVQAGDALYFDLAVSLGLPIATVDRGLRSAAKSHGVRLVTPAGAA